MSRTTYFVDVIVPIAVPNLYTYRVPYDLNDDIAIGKRVVVQFGKGKMYTALVRSIHQHPPKHYEAKYLEAVLDERPIVNEKQFRLWEWMSEYYMCTIGEIMTAALPGGLRLSSEAKIILSPDTLDEHIKNNLSEKEYLILEALELRQVLSLKEVESIIEHKTVYPLIKTLIEKGIIILQEELKGKYKPRLETFVQLTTPYDKEETLKTIFDVLEKKAGKQLDVLMAYIKLSERYSKQIKDVKKKDIVKLIDGAEAAIKALVKKNIFEIYELEVGRLASYESENKISQLNETQQKAFDAIVSIFNQSEIRNPKSEINKEVALLQGVTSSGKTEIYVKFIEQVIAQGKQVLYLLPEIALTTQIINRLRKYFGDAVGVYHSRYNENERVEIWNNVLGEKSKIQNPKSKIIIGARSALFLPFDNLGLVIVDEEHDTSFKQFDPAPRYNARDAAIYLAYIHNAKTLLGSATPSIESYYNALQGKYGFVELMERFGGIEMPEIIIADVKEATKRKQMKSHFAPLMLDTITLALQQKEQIILFQNRRGFAPQLECNVCAWVPRCTNCDVSLTYHKFTNQLRCHYCGYAIKPPAKCEACGDTNIKMKGFGTEKIEEELAIFFPHSKIARMDLDTTRSKFAHQNIIHDFEEHNIDILVGTQMVTKGLDFNNVSLVGILNADSMLNFPDFRAFERSYQMMTQVSGRAGRKNKRGKVIIQTHNPEHEIIKEVIGNNYLSMYTNQLLERKKFIYPPYSRLVEITVINKDVDLINTAAKYLADELKRQFAKRVLGPEFPIVSRIRNLFHKTILLKIEREISFTEVKKRINEVIIKFKAETLYKSVKVRIDVDPM